MPAAISKVTIAQSVDPIPPQVGMVVAFTLAGVLEGSVAMLLPLGFDPHIRIAYTLAVVDANASVTFEFLNVGKAVAVMPASFTFIVVTGL